MARIVLIDDDMVFCTLMASALRQNGHEVKIATDGRAGVEQVQHIQPDLVVTDLLMPEQEGMETVRKVRRIQPTVPILTISGGFAGAEVDYLELSRLLGADASLKKPFLPSDFLATVNQLLASRSQASAAN